MIGLDTNVLVRYFAQDDLRQSPIADQLIGSLTVEEPGFVGVATILELMWVMGSIMRLDNKALTSVLGQLLTREDIVIEQSDIVENAFQRFRKGSAEFADCLIASSARMAGCSKTVTFDRIAARDAGMELLG